MERRRFVYRGGNWNNGVNAGVFSLNGNNPRGNVNTNIGFRLAYAFFVHVLQVKAWQEHLGKRGVSPGRKAKDQRSCSLPVGYRGRRAKPH